MGSLAGEFQRDRDFYAQPTRQAGADTRFKAMERNESSCVVIE